MPLQSTTGFQARLVQSICKQQRCTQCFKITFVISQQPKERLHRHWQCAHDLRNPCQVKAVQDPLQEALYETWGAEADDWDTQEYTDDQLINVLYDDDKSPEALGQNVLALTLALLLCLAVGNVMWKIVAVSWALLSAAVRYSAVAFILLCIAAFIV